MNMVYSRFNFSEDFTLLEYTLPMLVSVTRNPKEETKEQYIINHDRFLELDEMTKDKLADVKTAEKIQNIGKINNLDLIQTSDIARAIRKYYFGELKKENIAFEISKASGVSMEQATAIMNAVVSQIIGDTSFEDRLEKMTLTLALKKYEKLGEQYLSGNPIKLKIFESPVRPSIKNWISDYYENVDARKHDSIERGNYLFHSENARRLTTGERQKVGTMLRALDEDSLVAVDPNRQELIFDSQEFSSTHKFPSEMNRVVPVSPKPSQARVGGNIVNLREQV